MAVDFFPIKTTEPDTRLYTIRILGVDDANPTEQFGSGVAITRTGEGVYRITWAANPGTFLGVVGFIFGAATMSDVKGYTVTRDTFDTTSYLLDLSVWNSSFAAADIIANQYLDITVAFK
jgi:hypothetical protein